MGVKCLRRFKVRVILCEFVSEINPGSRIRHPSFQPSSFSARRNAAVYLCLFPMQVQLTSGHFHSLARNVNGRCGCVFGMNSVEAVHGA